MMKWGKKQANAKPADIMSETEMMTETRGFGMTMSLGRLGSMFKGAAKKPKERESGHQPDTTTTTSKATRAHVDASAPKPMPLIGRLAARQQYALLGVLALISLAVAGALTARSQVERAHFSDWIETATTTQMLVQRAAKDVQEASIGSAVAFGELNAAVQRVNQNLTFLLEGDPQTPGVEGEARRYTERLKRQWERFNGALEAVTKARADITTLRADADRTAASMEKIRAGLDGMEVLMVQKGASIIQLSATSSMKAALERISGTLTQMARTSAIAPNAAKMLEADLALVTEVVKGLNEGEGALRLPRLADPELRARLAEIDAIVKPIGESVGKTLKRFAELSAGKQAGRNILEAVDRAFVGAMAIRTVLEDQRERVAVLDIGAIAAALVGLAFLGLLALANTKESARVAYIERVESMREKEEGEQRETAILQLMNEIGDLSEGDLAARATVTEQITGAIADSVNSMAENFSGVVRTIRNASSQVDESAGRARAVAEGIREAAETQANEVKAASTIVFRVVESVTEVGKLAEEAQGVARRSLEASDDGTQAVREAISSMDETRESVQTTSKNIKRLGESAQQIGQVSEAIGDLTEQINVLALNAQIQAAAAGEHGAGFAAVANEIQRLAARSGEQQKQVQAITASIQSDAQDAVTAMEVTTQRVVEGAKITNRAGTALQRIAEVTTDMSDRVLRISGLATQQMGEATRVADQMKSVLQITEQQTDSVKSAVGQVQEIAEATSKLRESVNQFKVIEK